MTNVFENSLNAHVSTATDCAEQVKYLVLAVKPQVLPTVFKELNGKIRKDQVVISIAAGYAIADLQAGLGDSARIVRSMPNTPAMVGAAVQLGQCMLDVSLAELLSRLDTPAGEHLIGIVIVVILLPYLLMIL